MDETKQQEQEEIVEVKEYKSKWARDETRKFYVGKIRGRRECIGFKKKIYDRIKPYYNKMNKHKYPKGLKGYRKQPIPVPEILKHIINEIAEQVIKNRAGVYFKGLGYFFIYSTPLDDDFKGNRSRRVQVNNRVNRLCMIPTANSPLKNYVIDYTNGRYIRKRIDDAIASGVRYLNLSSTVLSYDEILYGHRHRYGKQYKEWVEKNEI